MEDDEDQAMIELDSPAKHTRSHDRKAATAVVTAETRDMGGNRTRGGKVKAPEIEGESSGESRRKGRAAHVRNVPRSRRKPAV